MLQKIVEKVVLSNFCLGVTGEGLQNLVCWLRFLRSIFEMVAGVYDM